MEFEKSFLIELGVFHEEYGVFNFLNTCITSEGAQLLKSWIKKPFSNDSDILNRQNIIKFWTNYSQDLDFPYFTNGSMVMVTDFLKNQEDYNLKPSTFNLSIIQFLQRIFKKSSSNYISFHFEYIHSLFKALNKIYSIAQCSDIDNPIWNTWFNSLENIHNSVLFQKCLSYNNESKAIDKAKFLYFLKKDGSYLLEESLFLFSTFDAWLSLARLSINNKWCFPQVQNQEDSYLNLEEFYFPSIKDPIPFNLKMDKSKHLLLLTGANMSGKSTLLRSIGLFYILAQMGSPVPAKNASFTPVSGIYSNLSVKDNIHKGESYFYAEVLRMKQMAEKMIGDCAYLFLMDELFKGTNIQDASICTEIILKELHRFPQHLFLLSTHIYELAEKYASHNFVLPLYMETVFKDEMNYFFTHQLKYGVSKDKIGAMILKNEGVLKILKS